MNPFKIVNNFVKLFSSHILQKNITFDLDPSIRGDLSAIKLLKQHGIQLDIKLYEQILYHIFLNACKFNKVSGMIRMSFSVY